MNKATEKTYIPRKDNARSCCNGTAAILFMKQIIYLEPVLKENLWGGTRLAEYGYDLPSDHVGECWGVSAYPSSCCTVRGGKYHGRRLDDLWREEPELFGRTKEPQDFPLLIKIIDAQQDLSIQVHPDDDYAREHENGACGKTECWYVLDAQPGATIVIGHHAQSKEDLERMIADGRFRDLIRKVPVKAGDFFQIEPGTVHAIKAGTMVLETQESSDVTYRLYDYDRLQNGKKRPLHIKQSIDVIRTPFEPKQIRPVTCSMSAAKLTKYFDCRFYTVYKLEANGIADVPLSGMFHTMSVIDGEGYLDGGRVEKGDHLILTAGYGSMHVVGNFTAIVTRV